MSKTGLDHTPKVRVWKEPARAGRINVDSFSLPKRLLILYTCSCNLADRFIGQQESQLTTVLLQPVVLNNPVKERFMDRHWTMQEDILFFNVSHLRTVCLLTSCLILFHKATGIQSLWSVWWVRGDPWSWNRTIYIKLIALCVPSHSSSYTIAWVLKLWPSRVKTRPFSLEVN